MTQTLATLEQDMIKAGANRRRRRALKGSAPMMRIWKNNIDGSAGLLSQGRINWRDVDSYNFPMKNNFSSSGTIEMRANHPMGRYIATIPNTPTECKNVIITVDMYGGAWRWSGLLHHYDLETKDGCDIITLSFNDDLQFLQFMLAPPNPLLPIDVFQFPRDWPMFGPSCWCISTLILLQLLRYEGNLWTLPDDPFALTGPHGWLAILDWGDWQMHVKCNAFVDDSSIWTFLASRMNTVDSVVADSLDDGQLSLTYRRIITDDGETVSGLLDNNVANGALVYEVKDRSGFTLPGGTFFNGTAAAGLIRSVLTWTDGFVGDSLEAVDDSESLYPDEYWQQSFLGSFASTPSVALRDSHYLDLKSKVTWSPATADSVVVGGDNPTADAVIQTLIETTGDLIGYFLLGGFDSLGEIADSIIMPFLVGTVLAWDEWKNSSRVTNLGWVHLWEIFQSGAETNSWSLAALAAIRGGFKGTQSETCHTMIIGPECWAIPGLDFTIGDRIASSAGAIQRAGLDVLFVNQIEEMTLVGGPHGDYTFTCKAGKNKSAQSTGERLSKLVKRFGDAITDIGVHLIN